MGETHLADPKLRFKSQEHAPKEYQGLVPTGQLRRLAIAAQRSLRVRARIDRVQQFVLLFARVHGLAEG